ncbi:hypothetical protein AB0M83_43275 [Amycolatopsis sp. NPDC051106]|uniref:hypothetical protein n=1 Tax=unclassified Amycolatopsis TaxID=2618356 RepID=UPI00341A754D
MATRAEGHFSHPDAAVGGSRTRDSSPRSSLVEHPALENIRIVDAGPEHFVAKATVAQHIGNGVGPVFVDCGGEAGVTLLVTHV